MDDAALTTAFLVFERREIRWSGNAVDMTDSASDLIAQLISRYASWLAANEGLGVAVCWTVSRTEADASSIMDVFSPDWERYDAVDLGQLQALSYEDGSAREHAGWLISTGQHVGLLEVNGFGGSRRAGLQMWAENVPSLAGMFWNVNLVNQISVARDGQLATAELSAEGHISAENPLIARYQPFLTSGADLRAFGLAVVENETGLRLDDELLSRRWPLVRFAAREDGAPDEDTPDDHLDATLYAALVGASEARFREAKVLSARFVAERTGIYGEPAVQEAIEWNRTGEELAHGSRLNGQLRELCWRTSNELDKNWHRTRDLTDPAWRRMQAANVVERMTRVLQQYQDGGGDVPYSLQAADMQDVWQHVQWVAGELWPALRQQLIDIVT